MSPHILVLYGTTDGHTGKVAAAIASTLRLEGARVELADAADPSAQVDLDGCVAAIVAASVHAAGYQRSVARWVRRHAAQLRERPTAFVSVCLGVLEHDPSTDRTLDEIARKFFAKTGWQPDTIRIVAGALPYTRYNWLKRWMMKRIAGAHRSDTDTSRDYEYTDWTDLRAFASDFHRRVTSADVRQAG